MNKIYKAIALAISFAIMAGLHAATYTVTTSGTTFTPAVTNCTSVDTVIFSITGAHNAVEIDSATWAVGGTTPLAGGFSLPFGGGTVYGLSVGTHYYICTAHAPGMKAKIVVTAAPGPGIFQLTALGTPTIERFNGFTGTGFSPTPIAGQLNSNSWAITGLTGGPLSYGGTNISSFFARGTTTLGTPVSGGVYSLSGKPCFYTQPASGSFSPGTVTLKVLNNTGSAINRADINYNIFAYNDQSRSQYVNLAWGADTNTFYTVSSANYASAGPITSTWDSAYRSATITGFSIPNGSYLYIRWNMGDVAGVGSGSRDEIALDNISVTGLTTGSSTPPALNQVVINEFLPNNVASAVTDPAGHREDYIELFNRTASAIDLSNFSLNNSISSPYGWQIPSGTTLPASGYLVIWCDSALAEAGVHSNFRLANTSGSISLSNAVGQIIDSVRYTSTIPDTSISRIPNGTGAFRNARLTPLAVNDTFSRAANPSLRFTTISSSVNENVDSVFFSVSIASPNANPTSVTVVLDPSSTATSPSDYIFSSPITLTFPASSTAPQTFFARIVNDAIAEPNETMVFKLRSPTNSATLIDSVYTLTIIDDDVSRVKFDSLNMTVSEGVGTVTGRVSLTASSGTVASVDVVVGSSTATLTSDFTYTTATLNFPASTTGPQTFSFNIVDDALPEPTENIIFKLRNVSGGAVLGTDTTMTVNITDNDAVLRGNCQNLYFSEYIEGSSNNKALEIYNPTSSAVNLTGYKVWRFTNGDTIPTATLNLSGTIAAGDVFVIANTNADSLTIRTKADLLTGTINHNGDDAYALLFLTDTLDIIGQIGVDPGSSWPVGTGSTVDHTLLRSPYTYKGNTNWSTAVYEWVSYPIDMTDSLGFHHIMTCGTPAPASIRFDSTRITVSEAVATVNFGYTVFNPSGLTFTVAAVYDSLASTATRGADFLFADTTRNFPGSYTETVRILEDARTEVTENIKIRLLAVSGSVTIIDTTLTINITDNDPLRVTMTSAGFSASESAGTVNFGVKLTALSPNPTNVDVKYNSGTAARGADFTYTDTTLTFAANDTNPKLLPINIFDDLISEPNEQVIIRLLNPTNGAVLGTNSFNLIIVDNDGTGINEPSMSASISMFPNPVVSELIINTQVALDKLEVVDLLGRTVETQYDIHAGASVHVSADALASGTYMVVFQAGEKTLTKKFFKY